MDRKIVYPAQIPLVEDQLGASRFTQIGLGRLAAALFGESGLGASGLACVAGSGMNVSVSPGQIVQSAAIDATSYGALPADSDLVLTQYLLNEATTVAVPGVGATYIVYGTLSISDTDTLVLPFYNSANPEQVYAGPDNDGSSTAKTRASIITLGIATSVPSGSVPLWQIVVPSTATAITDDMISSASGAPFYPSLADIAPRIIAPFNAALAQAFGGYPLNAIVSDETTAGTYWRSTSAGNTTVPGATNANWASLLGDFATEEWVEAQDYATESYVKSGIVAGLGLSKHNSNPGYSTLPGGMIIQYGRSSSGSQGSGTIAFPIAFPTACVSVTLTESGASGTWPGTGNGGTPTVHGMIGVPSNTLFGSYSMEWNGTQWNGVSGLSFSWMAIGY